MSLYIATLQLDFGFGNHFELPGILSSSGSQFSSLGRGRAALPRLAPQPCAGWWRIALGVSPLWNCLGTHSPA